MEIKIFIQQTEDGSKVVCPLGYNEFAIENKKFRFFLKDEAHKADFANAYSMQINHDYKVYSLISSEITDYLGRSGSFFAIRVVIPNQKSIDEIHDLLNNIKERYMHHYQNKTMEKLFFDDLTDAVEDNNFVSNNNSIIIHGIDKEAFVLWDKSSTLNSYFTQKAASLVKCIYIFEKDKTESVVYERMLPFDEVKPLVRKIEIISNGLLESLKVNDVEINKPSTNSFELITTKEARVTYKRRDKKDFKILNGLENNLILHHEYQAPREQKKPSKPDSPKATIITLSFLSVLILGILSWLFWESLKTEELDKPTNPVMSTQILDEKIDENIVEFKIIDTLKSEKRYTISKPDSLSSYEFIYNSGWSFINKKGKNKPVDFSKKNIKEIFESNKIKFNDTINNNFIAELEKISGKKLPDETKLKVEETEVAKKKTEPNKIPGIKEKQQEETKSKNSEEIKVFKEGVKDK